MVFVHQIFVKPTNFSSRHPQSDILLGIVHSSLQDATENEKGSKHLNQVCCGNNQNLIQNVSL